MIEINDKKDLQNDKSNSGHNEEEFIIKLTDMEPPRYVFSDLVFPIHLKFAKKFTSLRAAKRYIKSHDEFKFHKCEIYKIE